MLNVEFLRTPAAVNGEDSFVRFLYLGEVTIPNFCKDKIVGDELCPIAVVLDYVATILPTAAQCPGIPRLSLGEYYTTVKSNAGSLKSSCGSETNASQAADRLFQQLAQLEHELGTLQDALKYEYKEKTHIERWSELR